MRRAETDPVAHAIADLCTLTQVDRGVLEAICCGTAAVPRLCALLFTPEPSGLFQSRCGAAEALAALGADDVLIEFLSAPYATEDPVAWAGTEAVMNAAARALMRCESPILPRLFLDLAEQTLLPGAIEWLGAHGSLEALPCLIRALGDDLAMPSAIGALQALGVSVRGALWDTVLQPNPNRKKESDTSCRRRRAALRVLRDLDPGAKAAPDNALQALADDDDIDLSVQGFCWLLNIQSAQDLSKAVGRLRAVRDRVNPLIRYDIDACLRRYGRAQVLSREAGACPDTGRSAPLSAGGHASHSNGLGGSAATKIAPAAGPAYVRKAPGAAR